MSERGILHREACDDCHKRKVRCIAYNGACQNCVFSSKSCTFSPRTAMGRPRKTKRTTSEIKKGGSASTASQDSVTRTETHARTIEREGSDMSAGSSSSVSSITPSNFHSSSSSIASMLDFNVSDSDLALDSHLFDYSVSAALQDPSVCDLPSLPEFDNTLAMRPLATLDNEGAVTDTLSSILFELNRELAVLTSNPSLETIVGTLPSVMSMLDNFCEIAESCIYPSLDIIHTLNGGRLSTVQQLVLMVVATSINLYSQIIVSDLFIPLRNSHDEWHPQDLNAAWVVSTSTLRDSPLRPGSGTNCSLPLSIQATRLNLALSLTQINHHLSFCQHVSISFAMVGGGSNEKTLISTEAQRLYSKTQGLREATKTLLAS